MARVSGADSRRGKLRNVEARERAKRPPPRTSGLPVVFCHRGWLLPKFNSPGPPVNNDFKFLQDVPA